MTSPSIDAISGFRRVGFPGELGIPPVGVSFEVPEAWASGPMPGALAVTMEPEPGPAGFRANVITSVQRVPAGTTLDAAAAELLEESRASVPHFVHSGEHLVEVAGQAGVLREQSIRIAESDLDLVQFVLITIVPRTALDTDVVQLTGSIELARRDSFGAAFEHLVASIVLDG